MRLWEYAMLALWTVLDGQAHIERGMVCIPPFLWTYTPTHTHNTTWALCAHLCRPLGSCMFVGGPWWWIFLLQACVPCISLLVLLWAFSAPVMFWMANDGICMLVVVMMIGGSQLDVWSAYGSWQVCDDAPLVCRCSYSNVGFVESFHWGEVLEGRNTFTWSMACNMMGVITYDTHSTRKTHVRFSKTGFRLPI